MQGRAHVSRLGNLYPQFADAGAEIIVILGEGGKRAQSYAQSVHSPFPILPDPGCSVYALYQLE